MPNNKSETDASLDERLYQQLKIIANKLMAQERKNHTLSATALVHEAFVVISKRDLSFDDKKHYFRTLATQMRRVLIDHARHKAAKKNKLENKDIAYTDSLGLVNKCIDFSYINDAIEELKTIEKRSAEVIDLVYFAALPQAQVAEFMKISIKTVERDLKYGRAFINEYIHDLGYVE
jgi:RNA polymerase sigma factor (TIGR02999 family)